jgi:hypothetical protein
MEVETLKSLTIGAVLTHGQGRQRFKEYRLAHKAIIVFLLMLGALWPLRALSETAACPEQYANLQMGDVHIFVNEEGVTKSITVVSEEGNIQTLQEITSCPENCTAPICEAIRDDDIQNQYKLQVLEEEIIETRNGYRFVILNCAKKKWDANALVLYNTQSNADGRAAWRTQIGQCERSEPYAAFLLGDTRDVVDVVCTFHVPQFGIVRMQQTFASGLGVVVMDADPDAPAATGFRLVEVRKAPL